MTDCIAYSSDLGPVAAALCMGLGFLVGTALGSWATTYPPLTESAPEPPQDDPHSLLATVMDAVQAESDACKREIRIKKNQRVSERFAFLNDYSDLSPDFVDSLHNLTHRFYAERTDGNDSCFFVSIMSMSRAVRTEDDARAAARVVTDMNALRGCDPEQAQGSSIEDLS
jgi:hypothetical protein